MNLTDNPASLEPRVAELERRLPQPVCSPEHAATIAGWRAQMIAKGVTPPDGLRTNLEASAFAAARARRIEAGR